MNRTKILRNEFIDTFHLFCVNYMEPLGERGVKLDFNYATEDMMKIPIIANMFKGLPHDKAAGYALEAHEQKQSGMDLEYFPKIRLVPKDTYQPPPSTAASQSVLKRSNEIIKLDWQLGNLRALEVPESDTLSKFQFFFMNVTPYIVTPEMAIPAEIAVVKFDMNQGILSSYSWIVGLRATEIKDAKHIEQAKDRQDNPLTCGHGIPWDHVKLSDAQITALGLSFDYKCLVQEFSYATGRNSAILVLGSEKDTISKCLLWMNEQYYNAKKKLSTTILSPDRLVPVGQWLQTIYDAQPDVAVRMLAGFVKPDPRAALCRYHGLISNANCALFNAQDLLHGKLESIKRWAVSFKLRPPRGWEVKETEIPLGTTSMEGRLSSGGESSDSFQWESVSSPRPEPSAPREVILIKKSAVSESGIDSRGKDRSEKGTIVVGSDKGYSDHAVRTEGLVSNEEHKFMELRQQIEENVRRKPSVGKGTELPEKSNDEAQPVRKQTDVSATSADLLGYSKVTPGMWWKEKAQPLETTLLRKNDLPEINSNRKSTCSSSEKEAYSGLESDLERQGESLEQVEMRMPGNNESGWKFGQRRNTADQAKKDLDSCKCRKYYRRLNSFMEQREEILHKENFLGLSSVDAGLVARPDPNGVWETLSPEPQEALPLGGGSGIVDLEGRQEFEEQPFSDDFDDVYNSHSAPVSVSSAHNSVMRQAESVESEDVIVLEEKEGDDTERVPLQNLSKEFTGEGEDAESQFEDAEIDNSEGKEDQRKVAKATRQKENSQQNLEGRPTVDNKPSDHLEEEKKIIRDQVSLESAQIHAKAHHTEWRRRYAVDEDIEYQKCLPVGQRGLGRGQIFQ